jgi:hypothetical protein
MRYRKPARFGTKPLAQARHTPKSALARLELALLDPQVAREDEGQPSSAAAALWGCSLLWRVVDEDVAIHGRRPALGHDRFDPEFVPPSVAASSDRPRRRPCTALRIGSGS